MNSATSTHLTNLLGLKKPQQQILENYIKTLEDITGDTRAIDQWAVQNLASWVVAMRALGLSEKSGSAEIRSALQREIEKLDVALREFFHEPNLSTASGWSGVIEKVKETLKPENRLGFFLKHDVAKRLLKELPPSELLEHFKLTTVDELLARFSVETIFASFRFAVSREYGDALLERYLTLTPDDFEHREISFVLMSSDDWFDLAEDFAKGKLHPFSHLKEMGVIFVIPNPKAAESTAVFKVLITLLFHYLYEVGFYSKYFIRIAEEKPEEFGELLKQVILGGIGTDQLSIGAVRITHQYYTKKPHPDPRVFEPHVMPEPIHWHNARRLLRDMMCDTPAYSSCILDIWDTNFSVGNLVDGQLFSLNYADNIVSVASQSQKTYHLFEDVWNQIFITFSSEHVLEEVLRNNLETGFINLQILHK